MKTAVSVPDDIFELAEQLARRERRSRSEVYSAALREYVARRSPDEVTEALDRVAAAVKDDDLAFTRTAAALTLSKIDW